MRSFDGCHCINAFVSPSGENRLDHLLAQTSIPSQFDLLSIDIDGDDYHVWESFIDYRPAVVVIEINIRNKPDVQRIHGTETSSDWGQAGTSILSMNELALRKGYALLANTGCNVIFVANEFLSLYHNEELSPAEVFLYEGHKLYELTWREAWGLGAGMAAAWIAKKVYQQVAFWRNDWEKNQ